MKQPSWGAYTISIFTTEEADFKGYASCPNTMELLRDRGQIQTYLGLLNSIAHDPSIMLFWWMGG